MEAQKRDEIDKGMQTLWVIWAAMLGSLLIYIVIGHQWGEGLIGTERTELPIGLLRKICVVLAAGALLTGYYLRRVTLKGRSGAARSTMVRRAASLKQPPFVTHYTSIIIVSLACSESVGIYGLLLFLFGDGFQTFYTFLGISALAMFYYRPKREELERLANDYKQRGEESH